MAMFKSKTPHFEHLKRKWTTHHNELSENLFEKHFRRAAISSLGGLMLLSTPGATLSAQQYQAQADSHHIKIAGKTDNNQLLAAELKDKVPDEVRALTKEEESEIGKVLTKHLGAPVVAEMGDKRLNRSYGMIGGEQHLYRYPGDTLQSHAKDASDWAMYGGSGIAPGLGAWGYFAPSKAEFTKEDEERERYYIAVQTFLSPGFSERVGEYRDFYKFRKMLLVNPKTGQAVVTVIGDAGPAQWTGKHLGGSPEVMHAVGHAKGSRKGPVLYFFIDDPDNQTPLGPVQLKANE